MTCLGIVNDLYHTKNQSDMEIRIYEKTELALLYFPRSEAKVALNRLKRWIKNNPELLQSPSGGADSGLSGRTLRSCGRFSEHELSEGRKRASGKG